MSGGYGKGLEYLNKLREERGLSGDGESREYTRQIWLGDDQDIAVWRFITDGDDIYWGAFHEVPKLTKAGKQFRVDVLCPGDETCERCRAAREDPKQRPWIKGVALVYVEQVQHYDQRQKGKGVSWNPDPAWKPMKRGTLQYFAEKIGEVRIWMIRAGMQQRVANLIGEHGTLTDVYYEFRRNGGKNTRVTYELAKTDPQITKMTAGCEAVMSDPPDVEEMVAVNFGGGTIKAKTVEGQTADTTSGASSNPDDDPFGALESATSVDPEDADELSFD